MTADQTTRSEREQAGRTTAGQGREEKAPAARGGARHGGAGRNASGPGSETAGLASAEPGAPAGRLRGRTAQWIGTVVRLGLAAVWAWAGLAKISDPEAAAQAVRAYRLLPEALVKPFGYGLPFLEVALALLLLLGLGTRIAAAVSGLLLLVYIGSIASVWSRGISIDCGCFGGGGAVSASKTAYLQEILRDIGFLALAAWLLRRPRTRLALDTTLAE